MAQRISEDNKKKIKDAFVNGHNIDDLALDFDCHKLTIIRNLKKSLGEEKFKVLINANKQKKNVFLKDNSDNVSSDKKKVDNKFTKISKSKGSYKKKELEENINSITPFVELEPVDYEIDKPQKDLSSKPLSSVTFPKTVYMIVDKNIELEVKLLKEFPDWQFLPEDDLERKTIEIFFDLKNAKRNCGKDKKVIKVPNTEVFKITAPILLSRGISRIVNEDQLSAI